MAKLSGARQSLGRWGEQLAAQYLQGQGYEILDRNVRTDFGELDLVARLAEIMVFVEVKTRTTSEYGMPEESITRQKAAHLLNSGRAYLLMHNITEVDWRIDLIAVIKLEGQPPVLRHIENAIH